MNRVQCSIVLVAVLAVGCVSSRPTHQSASMLATRNEIIALEHSRCEAITKGDVTTLAGMLADDYVHIHGTGKVDTKSGFLTNIQQHPRRTERGPLTVRVFGSVAVMTGDQLNYTETNGATPAIGSVTQVLRWSNGGWRYESFQLTPQQETTSKQARTVESPLLTAPTDRAAFFLNSENQSIWADLEARQVINKRVLEGGSFSINVRIVKPADAPLVHAHSADVWVVTSGTATAVTGGELVDSKQRAQSDDFAGTSIRGGKDQPLTTGDVEYVPPGVPHGFKDLRGFRAYLIRFEVKR